MVWPEEVSPTRLASGIVVPGNHATEAPAQDAKYEHPGNDQPEHSQGAVEQSCPDNAGHQGWREAGKETEQRHLSDR